MTSDPRSLPAIEFTRKTAPRHPRPATCIVEADINACRKNENGGWKIQTPAPVLRENDAQIVLTDRDLVRPAAWTGVLMEISTLPDPPLVIVTSRLAEVHEGESTEPWNL